MKTLSNKESDLRSAFTFIARISPIRDLECIVARANVFAVDTDINSMFKL